MREFCDTKLDRLVISYISHIPCFCCMFLWDAKNSATYRLRFLSSMRDQSARRQRIKRNEVIDLIASIPQEREVKPKGFLSRDQSARRQKPKGFLSGQKGLFWLSEDKGWVL